MPALRRKSPGLLLATALLSAAAATVPAAGPVGFEQQLLEADQDGRNWLTHGRNYSETRHSPLALIHTGNVGELGLAWYVDFDTGRGQEATPLVVDGIIYVSSSWSNVYAIDGRTGQRLWRYDAGVPGETAAKACCDVVNRGVAYWDGRVYVGTLDGRLVALDARSGKVLWSVLTVDPTRHYTITGAPRVVKGKVLIGNGGAEYGVRGYVSAYDAGSGALVWRFYTVPGDPSQPFENAILAEAARTWTGEWWKGGGGGTVWDSMAYDPELDLLYVGVGNGSPWNPTIRSPGGGDNLFLSSIVALRPDTGDYVWHYQTTPGEMWDFTATQHIVLADLLLGGARRKVLMQAPKNGFFYVLDRANGQLLSATPYASINWASSVDMQTGRPIINPEANYAQTGKPWIAMPGPLGAHNWHPMSFDPRSGLVFLPTLELGFVYIRDENFQRSELAVHLGVDLAAASLPQDSPTKQQVLQSVRGHLIAWDPIAQKKVWDIEYPAAWNGGVLSTAGNLVFQGDAGGHLNAYATATGDKLWSWPTQEGIVAPPIACMIDGEQYILVTVGWGGVYALLTGEIARKGSMAGRNGRLLAFRLGGPRQLPDDGFARRSPIPAPAQFADDETVARGKGLYHRYCGGCHGDAAVSGGVLPDLRWSDTLASMPAWSSIVLEGAMRARGMVMFAAELSADDSEAIRAYVIARSRSAGG
jgi:PQQ-dependent dehydrogenase (methanol/ethanol family)